jgi:hypothetical protein
MLAAYLSVIVGAVVALVYAFLLVRTLRKSKGEMRRHGGGLLGQTAPIADAVFVSQGQGLVGKTIGALLLSVAALAVLTINSGFWYAIPFLSIATAAAVVVAFILDEAENGA